MEIPSGEALLTVINDILDFSKIEAGRFDLDHSPFDLEECLGDTMKSLALRAHRKNLELAHHFSRDMPTIVVGEALNTLRSNLQEGNAFDLVITDARMPGMSGFELVEKIREDLRLASSVILMLTSSDQSKAPPTSDGMGSAGTVSAGLVSAGFGIGHILTKPVKKSELFNTIATAMGDSNIMPKRERPSVSDLARRIKPLDILLVEDSPMNQKLALALLQPYGHSVVIANNGREAVEFAKSRAYNLILMGAQEIRTPRTTAARTCRDVS